MADNKEDRSLDDLTEEASPKKLEDAKKKGKVVQSREISSFAVLFSVSICTFILSPKIALSIVTLMKEVFTYCLDIKNEIYNQNLIILNIKKSFYILIKITFPICIIGFIFGIVSSLSQSGFIFSLDPIFPDFDRLSPIEGFKNIFSLKKGMSTLRLIVKIISIIAISFFLLKYQLIFSLNYFGLKSFDSLNAMSKVFSYFFPALMPFFLFFSILDFLIQKYEYNKNLKMTKHEVKQEYKEREGNPLIKLKIRSLQREIAKKRMMQAVKKADVIITNPTHIAIAILYDMKNMSAPKVIAKGADFVAEKIKKIANESGIPLLENVILARTLYKTVKIGHVIPKSLYQAVAEVLVHIYNLKRR